MRRTERLFRVIQILRARRSPITGQKLADELEISLRTLYRDMAELLAQRLPIRGEAGTGYVLQDGYDLPPLMLTADELEAAVLGAAWVARRGDPSLARGARDLVAKLSAVVPPALRPVLLDGNLKPVSARPVVAENLDLAPLREALRERRKVSIAYKDQKDAVSERTIWPIFLAYTEELRIVIAWCEMRKDFRLFRTDRILSLMALEERVPESLDTLRGHWKEHDRHHSSKNGRPPTAI